MTDKDYTVRGCTALIDAIGGAIHHIGNIHKYARPEDVPEHTMFVITTDGQENASHRYNSEQVKKMIERQKEKYGWDVYKKAFYELYQLPRNEEEEKSMNNWEKFEYFLGFLSKHAGEDVHSCFTTAELNTIQTYLQNE